MLIVCSCSGGGSKVVTISGMEYKTIPGIAAVDVHGNFTNKGFELKKDIGSEVSSWTCTLSNTEYQYIVSIMGSGPTDIVSISGTVMNFTKKSTSDVAKDFLSFLATVSYKDAQPDAAKNWVLENIDKTSSTIIGNVKFEMTSNAKNARMLTLTEI